MLEINQVTKNFGGFTALHDLNMSVEEGQIHALIGPNGAGETTLFNLVSGSLPVSHGIPSLAWQRSLPTSQTV